MSGEAWGLTDWGRMMRTGVTPASDQVVELQRRLTAWSKVIGTLARSAGAEGCECLTCRQVRELVRRVHAIRVQEATANASCPDV